MAKATKLPSGSWRARVYAGEVDGKKKYLSFTADTKKEAEYMAAQYTYAGKRRPTEDITFAKAVERYIDSKSNVLKPSTITGYENIRRNYIGEIADIRINRITNEQLQRQINVVAADHSPKTVANCKGLYTAVLRMFVPDFHPSLKVPAKIRAEKRVPTDEEVRALLMACKGTDIELPIKLAAFGSLRRAEISGLFPDCIHEDHISIRRTFDKGPDRAWKLMESPKSSAGYRDVPLPPAIMEQLHRLAREADPGSLTFGIFGLNPTQIYERIQSAWERSGSHGYGVHALRHYFATFMHESGVPDKYIAEIGGWENIETLQRIYQHTTKKTLTFAASKMASQYDMLAKDDMKCDTK